MGGGFGSKLTLSKHTVIAALLARKTGRPVKLLLTREETFLCVGNRPANTMTLKAGAKKDGTITALELSSRGVVGAYASGAGGVYLALPRSGPLRQRPDRVHRYVYINAGPSARFRAPGFPQCAWALEQMMDALAGRTRAWIRSSCA